MTPPRSWNTDPASPSPGSMGAPDPPPADRRESSGPVAQLPEPCLPHPRTLTPLIAAIGLLFISALPDAMVVPVLKQLLIDRYGVTVAQAHAFMAVNLVGAILIAGLVGRMKRRWSPLQLICSAALINGILLGVMALPIGFLPTLAIRCVEGASDLLVYALLFDVIARLGPASTTGRRMGASATFMMLGIACGIGLGGAIGRTEATLTLWTGMGACFLAALGVLAALRRIPEKINAQEQNPSTPDRGSSRGSPGGESLWPSLVMMFGDRAVAGLLASTIPLYFAASAGFSTVKTGAIIGVSMLMTALGAWPMGRLAERIGIYKLRTTAGVIYVSALVMIVPASSHSTPLLLTALLLFGLAGAALFASSLLFVCNSGRGATGMAAYHAAGNAGFLCGPLTAGACLMLFGGNDPSPVHYQSVLLGFGVVHMAGTAIILLAKYRTLNPSYPVGWVERSDTHLPALKGRPNPSPGQRPG